MKPVVEPTVADFPCDSCIDPVCIAFPDTCNKVEEIKSWKDAFKDLIRSRISYFELNYPPDYFLIVKRELRALLKKETTPE